MRPLVGHAALLHHYSFSDQVRVFNGQNPKWAEDELKKIQDTAWKVQSRC